MVERKAFFANQKHQYRVPQYGEYGCSANNRKNRDYYGYLSLSQFTNELWLYGKWWKEKLFLQFQSINTVYPNVENMMVVPIIEEWRLLWVSKHVSFQGWILIISKIVERKAFLANPKCQYRVSQSGEHDCSANNKKNGDYYEQTCFSHFMDELWL